MIITLTPSPAIDWTAHVDTFTWGAVNRIGLSSREPSGKGLNVSWALHRAGAPTTAVFPGGGSSADFMTSTFQKAGLGHVHVPTGHEVRTNLTLVTGGEATKVNEPGVELTDQQATALVDAAIGAAHHARAVLLCGSHPAGFTAEHVARLVTGIRALDAECVLDTSGAALADAVTLGPDLVKPNIHELAELTGKELHSLGDVVGAAREVCARGTRAVLASLGADGAVHVTAERAVLARAEDIPFVNSVGAGDALLAGFMAGTGDAAKRLETAVLWASSAVACPTTLFPVREEFRGRITVTEWRDAPVPLSEPGLPRSTDPSTRTATAGAHQSNDTSPSSRRTTWPTSSSSPRPGAPPE